jgi:hypothetical protein
VYKTERELKTDCACEDASVVAKIQITGKNKVKLPLRYQEKEDKKCITEQFA